MPAKRKRPDQRQRNTDDRRQPLELVPKDGPQRVQPDMPSPREVGGRWLKATTQVWERYWNTDVSQAVDPDADWHRLVRWITAVDDWYRATRAVRQLDSLLAEGSTGQLTLHPLVKRANDLERRLEEAEDHLGMTPKARADLGVAVGQAQLTAQQLSAQANQAAEELDGEVEVEVLDGGEWESG